LENSRLEPSSLTSHRFQWDHQDAYLFDIDGTLLNTRDLVHYNALNYAMRDVFGVDTTIDGIAYHGKTDLGILRAALNRANISDHDFAARLPQALAYIREHVLQNRNGLQAHICDAIPEMLAHLRSLGKLIAVASGNLESVGWHKIEAAGLREFFTFGCFADGNEMRADIFRAAVQEARDRLGEHAAVCFIGDTPEDIRAARTAGALVIAVCTGIYKSADLAHLHPDACISSCDELLRT
jgi:phosphoglycolate phosphatase-like HAD superfamily hydrolase